MRLEIFDATLGIATIDSMNDIDADIREKLKEEYGDKLDDIVVVYIERRDWIVINKSHPVHEIYITIIQGYINLTVEQRAEVAECAPCKEINSLLQHLDMIINKRQVAVS